VEAGSPRRAALGQAVRRRRLKRGLTIEALAAAADMHPTFLSGIERGRHNPSIEKLWALADSLDCTLTELVRDTERRMRSG
jgi:transcriptional regulator with XRE-family HTH domain